MRTLRAWLHRCGGMFRRIGRDRELADEISGHLEMHVEDNLRAGMMPDTARREALLRLGGIDQTKERYRDRRGLPHLETLLRDFRFGARLLRKNPGFTITAVLILALGIGANTAIYTIVDRVLLRPLPYPDAERLATIARHYERSGATSDNFSQNGTTWLALHDAASFIDVAAAGGTIGVNLAASEQPEYVEQQRVSASFFRVLGVSPALGREFSPDEDRVNGPAVAVLSHALWARSFGADPQIIGRSVLLAGQPHTIVGVMPLGFRSNTAADLWTPLRPSPTGEGAGLNYVVIARLHAGVTWAEGDGQVASIGTAVSRTQPLPAGLTMRLRLAPLQVGLTSGLRQPLFILWGAVGAVLAIGCFNIAGLLLARARTRASEIATRIALGSGRAAIVRQLLAESAVLAAIGGLCGIALGYLTLQAFGSQLEQLFGAPASLDLRVLAATSGVSLGTCLVFGLLPAFQASRTDVRQMLVESGGATIAGTARRWPRRLLVVTEVALSVVLLVGAGLLLRTLARLTDLRPGFDQTNVVTATLSLQDARYQSGDSINALFDRSLERMRSVPGVERAAVCLTLPYERALNLPLRLADRPNPQPETINVTYVTPEYFDALRIPIVRGRAFNDFDGKTSTRVIVVNQALVRRAFSETEPLGRQVVLFDGVPAQIIGIVGDIQQKASFGNYGPVGPIPAAYIPAAQVPDAGFKLVHTWFSPSWVVRTAGNQPGVTEQMQQAIRTIDPQLPFNRFRTFDDVRSEAVVTQRVQAALLGSLATVALLLTAVGVYGLVASLVAERKRELGLRIALGATLSQTMQTAALPSIILGGIGVAIGLGIAYAGAGVMQGLVFGVSMSDPLTFVGAAGAVLLIAAVAALIPALRIVRLNVVSALRHV